jgi:hypothetical protein
LTSSDLAEKQKKLSAELTNGRLAMISIIGMFFQDSLTGFWNPAGFTASPPQLFENELGEQNPVGSWDPAGFTANSSVQNLQRRRQTELKHGRIAIQDGLIASAWDDQASYNASPQQAFENEVSEQEPARFWDPTGFTARFWDPTGFTANGSVGNLQRRRQTEIKHGRIAMLVTMMHITSEITVKLPDLLLHFVGLEFAHVPNPKSSPACDPEKGSTAPTF